MIVIGMILTAAALSNLTEEAAKELKYRSELRKINRKRRESKRYALEYDTEYILYGR